MTAHRFGGVVLVLLLALLVVNLLCDMLFGQPLVTFQFIRQGTWGLS